MKKLNNKGYMLIEIILAAVITFTIAFSLLSLIINFKNKNEDLYGETVILTAKTNITKNILNDIKDDKIESFSISNPNETIEIVDFLIQGNDETPVTKRLKFTKKTDTTDAMIEYGLASGTENIVVGNKSYYKRKLSGAGVDINDIIVNSTSSTAKITIPIQSIYSDKKYDIILIFNVDKTPVIKQVTETESSEIWQYKNTAKKIVIQNKQEKIEGAEEFDISSLSNKSVMAYYQSSDQTIYIKGDGNIQANPNSSYLFSGFTKVENIEGLEYLDTKNVTDMSNMFNSLGTEATTLTINGLSDWNVTKVTNMSNMFKEVAINATSCTINKYDNWDTKNVTNMESMFEKFCSKAQIDIGKLDIYATNINNTFNNVEKIIAELNIHTIPTDKTNTFFVDNVVDGSSITLNYTEGTKTTVESIVTEYTTARPNVVKKGNLIN